MFWYDIDEAFDPLVLSGDVLGCCYSGDGEVVAVAIALSLFSIDSDWCGFSEVARAARPTPQNKIKVDTRWLDPLRTLCATTIRQNAFVHKPSSKGGTFVNFFVVSNDDDSFSIEFLWSRSSFPSMFVAGKSCCCEMLGTKFKFDEVLKYFVLNFLLYQSFHKILQNFHSLSQYIVL